MDVSRLLFCAVAVAGLAACAAPAERSTATSGYGYGSTAYGYGCVNCGVVEAIAYDREAPQQGIGIGAIAGGVAGAAIGSQIGSGSGQTAATIAGAAGGAAIGHQIEQQNRGTRDVYRVTVRMDDGTRQTVTMEADSALRIGDPVQVVDGRVVRR